MALYFSVNAPHYDEWEYFAPDALDSQIDLAWLFGFHNEHRLVFTKILAWILLRMTRLYLPAQVAVNLILYGALCYLILRFIRRKFGVSAYWLLFPLGSVLPWDIHGWSFQTHFPLYVLLFWIGLSLLRRHDAGSWWSVPFSMGSAYAFAGGFFCAMAAAAAAVIFAWHRPAARWRHTVQGLLIAAGTGSWLVGF